MTFFDAIKTCLCRKYAAFDGRASRSEFWWFWLFSFLVNLALGPCGALGCIAWAALLLPDIAVTARRLHDTDRSGFLQLVPALIVICWPLLWIFALPLLLFGGSGALVGWGFVWLTAATVLIGSLVYLLVLCCRRGTPGPNRFGADPLGASVSMTCPSCGAAIPAGPDGTPQGRFCSACGAPVPERPQAPAGPGSCAFCGKPLQEGAVFCSFCGRRVD